jgi:Ca2+-binding EF-hand superfamily protein
MKAVKFMTAGSLTACALALMVSSGAMAAEMAAGEQASQETGAFSQLDTNRDGQISREEAQRHSSLEAKFDQADADHNGNISQSEFSAFEVMEMQAPAPGEEGAPKGSE